LGVLTGIVFLIKIRRRRSRIPGRRKMTARYAHTAMETPTLNFSKSDGECTHLIFLHIFLKGSRNFEEKKRNPRKTRK